MFPNLNAELARNNLTIKQLAKIVDLNYDTLKTKVAGKNDFKRKEIFLIKDLVFPSLTVDYLFNEKIIN